MKFYLRVAASLGVDGKNVRKMQIKNITKNRYNMLQPEEHNPDVTSVDDVSGCTIKQEQLEKV